MTMALGSIKEAVARELAPQGRLRVAINFGNSVLAQRDPSGGGPRGVSVDLAHELGSRLGVQVDLVEFAAAGQVVQALEDGAWDVAFLAIDPARSVEMHFTPPYLLIEGAYMVRADSPISGPKQVDRDGIRIGAGVGSAYDLFLTRTLKRAQLHRSPTAVEAFDRLAKGEHDVAAGVRPVVERFVQSQDSLRVLSPSFMSIQQAIAIPRRPEGAFAVAYLSSFLQQLKSNGFIATSLHRSGQTDAAVAPDH